MSTTYLQSSQHCIAAVAFTPLLHVLLRQGQGGRISLVPHHMYSTPGDAHSWWQDEGRFVWIVLCLSKPVLICCWLKCAGCVRLSTASSFSRAVAALLYGASVSSGWVKAVIYLLCTPMMLMQTYTLSVPGPVLWLANCLHCFVCGTSAC